MIRLPSFKASRRSLADFFLSMVTTEQGVVEARDSLLELGAQHRAVCDDDHGVEDGLVVIVMEAGQTVGGPGDRVGLPGTGAVLHQIVFAGAVGSDILDQRRTTSIW